MINALPTQDLYEIKTCLAKDNIYKQILEIDSLDNWVPDLYHTLWILPCLEHKEIGIMCFQQFSTNTLIFHGGLFKQYRGMNSKNWLQEILAKLRQTNDFQYITTVLTHNKLAQKLLKQSNFKQIGYIKNGSKKGDLILYGEE